MTVVVLGAAVVNLYTQQQILSSIVQMTRYRTDVTEFSGAAPLARVVFARHYSESRRSRKGDKIWGCKP
ncbi:hypothetical protein PF005_g27154 [Phytophthora fragariae]|uniref:Uncharacterized protein n=2 Tax=Phytophthora fragariae TaxID=53985 RepID=A0A6A3QHJ6_9STRA|nr:hypothetical protein PF003_g37400 [Phytophthora fragariae]KAE8968952.1 hypothetical protein PF011_g26994 [Phytophthora fragariae]KAE9066741.1 hypothetical protein PF007_g28329 [Phytophthora fragariae]KAE9076622.1 hypothetical protein PF006_g28091 [Phytophthora fragariae]KAE9171404.1 hypothetical protein PF005_g27154 [Phytophthora fragariae]